MKRRLCIVSRPSHQVQWSSARFLSTLVPPSNEKPEFIESSIEEGKTQPTAAFGDSERATSIPPIDTLGTLDADKFIPSSDDHRTLRRRLDGRPLPVPPLLDPRVDAARRRHELVRALQDWNNLTPLQEELIANPWAQILLTPVRRDAVTGTILPRFFLQPLGISFLLPSPSSKPLSKPHRRGRSSSFPPPTHAAPHIVPLHRSASSRGGTKTYALLGQRLAALLVKSRATALSSPRNEAKFGVRRDSWFWDLQSITRGAEGFVLGDVKVHLRKLEREGLLEVESEARTKGEGTVVVVLDPVRARLEEGREKWDGNGGYGFVLPKKVRGESQRLGRRMAKKGKVDVMSTTNMAEQRRNGEEGLGSGPVAVSFALSKRTTATVEALVRMDLFYRTRERSGREEILSSWYQTPGEVAEQEGSSAVEAEQDNDDGLDLEEVEEAGFEEGAEGDDEVEPSSRR
ncbi:hypothetical protein K461DRAFT_311484 [Myriangium duriaei CBS 260.36]|uniref:Uncharacterized protein n=1 Tax=Myriangium duriaei CBS 260.36 TaxID=1168546 RepID=A0A9P4J5V0_9PEZI|nr:hypothetical protein K461DRAFT_311484 [Myriangium duriaei CBS 260.36]